MRTYILLSIILLGTLSSAAQVNYLNESESDMAKRMSWFTDAKYGLFIHFGLYSQLGGIYEGNDEGRYAEWIQANQQIPKEDYVKLINTWNPKNFDAGKIVKLAKNAGMKYLVVTTKHHEGFCLWDSEFTEYDIANSPMTGRDFIKELSEACKKQGIRFGTYYSIIDWNHPSHDIPGPDAKDVSRKRWQNPDLVPGKKSEYVQYMKNQIKELIEKYNTEILWFDGDWANYWTLEDGDDLYQYVRELKPDIIINNRVSKRKIFKKDFGTPEQFSPDSKLKHYWEACYTMNDSWGFKIIDTEWKSPEVVYNKLKDINNLGGNFLLNVGPDGNGEVPPESAKILIEVGKMINACSGSKSGIPSYLEGYEEIYAENPREAALTWFEDAKFGMFIHYGLYSLLEGYYGEVHSKPAEWVQMRGKIPLAEYEKLADKFTAENFDADFITDLALDAGMKYINITTRHHDSFCLFDSEYTDFNSTNSAAGRDLIAELAEQCQKKGLGLFFYYSHGRDWRHPHAFNEEWSPSARPAYESREQTYKYGEEHNLDIYLEFMKNQITELLTNYGPVAGIWLDGIGVIRKQTERWDELKVQELYDHIHSLQPQTLVSYKQGLLGTEDFKAPERHFKGESDVPLEICNTMQPYSWGYDRDNDVGHKTPEEVMEMLKHAGAINANLLLNIGPLPDGSVFPDDIKTLTEVGRHLR